MIHGPPAKLDNQPLQRTGLASRSLSFDSAPGARPAAERRSALPPQMRRRSFAILISLAVILTLCYVALRTIGKRMYPDPDTDPAHYSAVLAEWKQTGLVKLFPASIASDAKGIHLSAFPGCLQGRPWIQLRMQLPPDQVAAIEADARAATDHVYTPDHRFFLPAKNGDWPIPNYVTGDRPEEFQFPATFKLYVISAVDRGMGSWDPTESYGVAVSSETNEVVYWADR